MVPSSDRRVLVIDDNESVRRLIRINLELDGFEVATASDGRQGMALARAFHPQVITLDVVMPVLDGLATLAEIRADRQTADIKVVMVSARASESDVRRGVEVGADAYVTKPFDPAELVRTVTELACGDTGALR
jgi:DNA-binding response OmpR family regulator